MITLIQATEEHIPIIRDIAHRTWPDTFGAILSPEQISYMLDMMYSPDALNEQILKKNHVFLLAQETGSNVNLGFISYELNYKGQAKTKIHKLYLLPTSQGKGVGRLLLDTVAQIAIDHQNRHLTLNVNRNNKAVRFYERVGFAVAGNETIDIGDGFLMEDFVMEKPLNASSDKA